MGIEIGIGRDTGPAGPIALGVNYDQKLLIIQGPGPGHHRSEP